MYIHHVFFLCGKVVEMDIYWIMKENAETYFITNTDVDAYR